MKKVLPILLMMILCAGIVFAANSLTLTSPADNAWTTDQNTTFNFTITETENVPGWNCSLYWNNNGTYYTNSTLVRTNLATNSSHQIWPDFGLDNNTGVLWNVNCVNNGSSGGTNSTWGAANYTVLIDGTDPSGGGSLKYPSNDTVSTDYNPPITIYAVTEENFKNYTILFDNDSDISSPYALLHISCPTDTLATCRGNNTYVDAYRNTSAANETEFVWETHKLASSPSNLVANTQYYWKISAHDWAGNNKTVTGYYYKTDSTHHTLLAGQWNVVGIGNNESGPAGAADGTTLTAKELCVDTGATHVSKWRYNHTFGTHTCGASSLENMTWTADFGDNPGEGVAFIYVATNQTWENQTYSSTDFARSIVSINLTNTSGIGWNIVSNINQTSITLGQWEDVIMEWNRSAADTNLSVSVSSVYKPLNASGSRWIPYVTNWTLNENQTTDEYEALWVYYDASAAGDDLMTFNFTKIGGFQ